MTTLHFSSATRQALRAVSAFVVAAISLLAPTPASGRPAPAIHRGAMATRSTPTTSQAEWLAAPPEERVLLAERLGEKGAELWAASSNGIDWAVEATKTRTAELIRGVRPH